MINAAPPLRFLLLVALCFAQPLLADPARAGRLEAGNFTAHATNADPNPRTVTFQQPFDTPPVVVALVDDKGSNSSTIRITNITTTGFDELILEPDSWDGRHIAQDVQYLAVEPGRHVLPDGSIIEAGFATVSAIQHGGGVTGPSSWASISFSAPLPSAPAVIMQLQSANSETRGVASQSSQPFITASLQNAGPTGFELALERSEAGAGPIPSPETIGWIAFPAGASGSFPDLSGSAVQWSASVTAANVAGWDNGCFTNPHGLTSGTVVAIAKKVTRNGGDGGWLRRCSLSATDIGLTVDEDTANDTERSHTGEAAAILAFSRPFHARLVPELSVTKVSQTLPGALGDFALPGAVVEYLIIVSNSGNAPPNWDSLVLTETLPTEVALVVDDFAAPGSGPLQFTDGSPATGLGCSFIALSSPSDCYDFSTDGISYSYVPVPGPDGTDPAVTHIRIAPSGFLAADTGAGPTSLQLRFRARIAE
ncbi:MAG: hypothetical protein KDD98_12830 [Sphingomonadaceae bacterium]|nr:hypothetical protein [Sphingomonadaceae bacterium]